MDKFGRNYNLKIELQNGSSLTITLPFTVEFNIIRNLNSEANTATTRIYNLSKEHRNQIRFNMFRDGNFRKITIQAGYGDFLSTIHVGQIQEALSYREGVDFITEIISFDGYTAYAQKDNPQNIPASNINPVSKKSAFSFGISKLPDVSQGAIGDYTGFYYRPIGFNNAIDWLREESIGGFYIDNAKAHILQDNEYIQSTTVPLINAQSGLLGTPRLQQTYLTFDMLFEPSLYVGQKIQLESQTFQDVHGANLNGFYKINELKHKATISPVVCGEAITSVGMLNGVGALTGVTTS